MDGISLPYAVVAILIVLELIIALGLFFGFLTRLAGLAVVVLMTGAIIYIHGGGFLKRSSIRCCRWPRD